jgi:hypothetical protein
VAIERHRIGVVRVDRGPGHFAQHRPQPAVARRNVPAEPLATALPSAWTQPCPRGEVGRRGEAAHVSADFRDNGAGRRLPYARNRLQQCDGVGERGLGRLNLGRQLLELPF